MHLPRLFLGFDLVISCRRSAVLLGIAFAVASALPCIVWAESASLASQANASEFKPSGGIQEIEAKLSRRLGAFIALLDQKQKTNALYGLEDVERFDLRLAPLGLEGLQIEEMTEAQWEALHAAMGLVLSPEGLAKADTIRSLEVEVAATEGGLFGLLMDWIRKPKRYFLSVYGDPGKSEAWGMRLDGHHLSLNWTAVSGEASGQASGGVSGAASGGQAGSVLSVTPLFFGGQPREVPRELERAGLRVLAAEEDLAVELIEGLDDSQKKRARVPFEQGSQISRPAFKGADPQLDLAPPAGLPVAAMSDVQQAAFDRLLSTHLANFAAPIAAHYRAQIEEERDTLHFAYAVGGEDPLRSPVVGEPLYYRIQTSDFLIEFDDTPKEANHIHVVIRSAASDFGRDRLREHYASEH